MIEEGKAYFASGLKSPPRSYCSKECILSWFVWLVMLFGQEFNALFLEYRAFVWSKGLKDRSYGAEGSQHTFNVPSRIVFCVMCKTFYHILIRFVRT